MVLGTIFLTKEVLIFSHLLGRPFWKMSLSCLKKHCDYFWPTFGKIGLLFISTSGHTACVKDRENERRLVGCFLFECCPMNSTRRYWECGDREMEAKNLFLQTRSWSERNEKENPFYLYLTHSFSYSVSQCDQIWRNFEYFGKMLTSLAMFFGLIYYLA